MYSEPREIGLAGQAPIARAMRRDVPTVFPETPLPQVLQAVISTSARAGSGSTLGQGDDPRSAGKHRPAGSGLAPNPLPDVLVSAFEVPTTRMTAIVAINRGGADATLSLALPVPATFGSLTTYRTSATESLVNLGTAVVGASSTRVSLKAQSVTTLVGGVTP